ncbi:deoxyribonuclease TatD-like protein [Pasteurella canis]|nr:deoxyribonuclease TatD-like protein [Pasteurella canis]
MAFFDTHTHLDYLQRDTGESIEQLLSNALQVGVNKILIVSVLAQDFNFIQK